MTKKPIIRVLSLGAGVKSSTLALMAARGEVTAPDCAIFADTGWEPKAVYKWLDWLEGQLPFPLYRVSSGDIRADTMAGVNSTGQKFSPIPWFFVKGGKKGMGRRQCTREYKLRPIQRKVIELMGGKRPKDGCEMLIGISMDEAGRMKPSRVQYIKNVWPLIDMGMSRQSCLRWMEERQYPKPPKSACVGCPFHSDFMWRDMKDNDPESWADALEVDRAIRKSGSAGANFHQFMHHSFQPLDEVDLSTWAEKGQPDLFNMECEGMCGV